MIFGSIYICEEIVILVPLAKDREIGGSIAAGKSHILNIDDFKKEGVTEIIRIASEYFTRDTEEFSDFYYGDTQAEYQAELKQSCELEIAGKKNDDTIKIKTSANELVVEFDSKVHNSMEIIESILHWAKTA